MIDPSAIRSQLLQIWWVDIFLLGRLGVTVGIYYFVPEQKKNKRIELEPLSPTPNLHRKFLISSLVNYKNKKGGETLQKLGQNQVVHQGVTQ